MRSGLWKWLRRGKTYLAAELSGWRGEGTNCWIQARGKELQRSSTNAQGQQIRQNPIKRSSSIKPRISATIKIWTDNHYRFGNVDL
ncbi:unnamed protein product [Meloidogyne enterolobii]|uniref:Uncharacterized protein n=1 Tax=Meloidogyne enterolobii TaxID=390850 RepID=A0ACB0ZHS4_MELEN